LFRLLGLLGMTNVGFRKFKNFLPREFYSLEFSQLDIFPLLDNRNRTQKWDELPILIISTSVNEISLFNMGLVIALGAS
jgi:hypothetical protein